MAEVLTCENLWIVAAPAGKWLHKNKLLWTLGAYFPCSLN